ncbi:MAG: trypsin-like peptidase domain-containing protein [Deltaproteobacteria bacterium]|nr:trypsin-like peptidase domain-containing protein [Deltaproteobacteria bacterium]
MATRPAALARRWRLVAAAHLALAPKVTSAVIVAAGAGDAEPPVPDPGVARVAIVAGLSGVYLGKGWVLTAGHVLTAARNQKKTEALIADRAYHLDPGSSIRLESSDGKADLALVRIEGDPGLPPLAITTRTPPIGARLVLAGNGPLQESRRGCWDAVGKPVAEMRPGVRCGFAWRKTPEGKTNGVQWGTNQVAGSPSIFPGPEKTRTRVFPTSFRDGLPTPREAQAGVGDSGGPVFVETGAGYELAGILLGVSARSSGAALFGDRTYAADLSAYREQIEDVLEHR